MKRRLAFNIALHQNYVSVLTADVQSEQDCSILSPLLPHKIIADQATNLVVNLIAREAENEVLWVDSMVSKLARLSSELGITWPITRLVSRSSVIVGEGVS